MAVGHGKRSFVSFPMRGIVHMRRHLPGMAGGPHVSALRIEIASLQLSLTFRIAASRMSSWWAIVFGGTVVQKVVEEIPNHISRIVFLDAIVLGDNQCVFDNLPEQYVALFNSLAAESSDNSMLIPWEVWRDN